MITAQMIREALQANPEGFYIDHEFPSALSDGFPMYHDAPIVGKWLQSIGFEVVKTWDGATSGFALTAEGIQVYRGGFVGMRDSLSN
jgi:hypothetical protein